MDYSTPGFPDLYHLPELAQIHVHWVRDAIQASHPLSSPSPPAFNLPHHQGLFQWAGSSYQVAKVLRVNEAQGTGPMLFLSSSSSPSNFSSRDKPYVWIFLYLMRLHSLKQFKQEEKHNIHFSHDLILAFPQGLSCDGSPWVLKFQTSDLLPSPSPSELKLCHVLGLPWYLRW